MAVKSNRFFYFKMYDMSKIHNKFINANIWEVYCLIWCIFVTRLPFNERRIL